jgi:hypothetical protein
MLGNVSPLGYNINYNQLTKRIENKMTITYSLWDGAQFLGFFTANSADEMNKTLTELQKISKNVVAHMRKVEQN